MREGVWKLAASDRCGKSCHPTERAHSSHSEYWLRWLKIDWQHLYHKNGSLTKAPGGQSPASSSQ